MVNFLDKSLCIVNMPAHRPFYGLSLSQVLLMEFFHGLIKRIEAKQANETGQQFFCWPQVLWIQLTHYDWYVPWFILGKKETRMGQKGNILLQTSACCQVIASFFIIYPQISAGYQMSASVSSHPFSSCFYEHIKGVRCNNLYHFFYWPYGKKDCNSTYATYSTVCILKLSVNILYLTR